MLKRIKIIDEQTKQVLTMEAESSENWAIENGYSKELQEVEHCDWNNLDYLQGFIPEKPAPTIEEIKAERERLYVLYTDKLKNDYDEDVARYGLESSEALASKKIWLDKKDEIRENNPYNDADEEI